MGTARFIRLILYCVAVVSYKEYQYWHPQLSYNMIAISIKGL